MKFDNLIGQSAIKSALSFYMESEKKGGVVPVLSFEGARGLGKTQFARDFAKGMKKPFIELNSATIKNKKAFFEQVFIPVIMGNECVILLDEAHALPKDLQEIFLTVFNIEKGYTRSIEWDGSTLEFDLRKQTFLLATTDAQRFSKALKDRLETVDFKPYSEDELGKILEKHLDGIKIDPAVLPNITDTLRGNARSAVKCAKKILAYCNNKNKIKFGVAEWKELCKTLGINASGLTNSEIEVLRVLAERGSCSLQMLAAVTGQTREVLQRDVELFLLKKGYMTINGQRMITGAGINMLAKVATA